MGAAPAPAIYRDIPIAEYRTWPLPSQSGIKELLKSPAHYRHYLETPRATKAMDVGSALDCRLLEPNLWADRFVRRPQGMDFRTKAGKEWRDSQQEAGRTVLDAEDADFVAAAWDAVHAHPDAWALYEGSLRQVSVVWQDPATEVRCKGRLDMLQLKGSHAPAIVDLKKCRDGDACPARFPRTARTYGLDVQAAMYSDALRALGHGDVPFYLLVVEQAFRPMVVLYRVTDQTLAIGRKKYRDGLALYKRCVESGEWPGYGTEVLPLELWGRDEDMEAFETVTEEVA